MELYWDVLKVKHYGQYHIEIDEKIHHVLWEFKTPDGKKSYVMEFKDLKSLRKSLLEFAKTISL